eukprot:scaffold4626_cov110-Skeletonema_dohrnii-CCMP3373.AAC.2
MMLLLRHANPYLALRVKPSLSLEAERLSLVSQQQQTIPTSLGRLDAHAMREGWLLWLALLAAWTAWWEWGYII